MTKLERLASYRRCVHRIAHRWPAFQAKRSERLQQQDRWGEAAEKVAENILEDLFTEVLDWSLGDLNNQVEFADLELTTHGIKRLLIEVKRPGMLQWSRRAVERALAQAWRYADDQRVSCIAVSDGGLLYAANITQGGLQDRVFVTLDAAEPPLALWWLSVHGIYHPSVDASLGGLVLPAEVAGEPNHVERTLEELLHPRYHLPASCFAYVGNAQKPSTWRLPYRLADGRVDEKRLPKAIQAILSNYRGTQVRRIPDADIPAVLRRLAEAASTIGRFPPPPGDQALAYRLLADALEQLDR